MHYSSNYHTAHIRAITVLVINFECRIWIKAKKFATHKYTPTYSHVGIHALQVEVKTMHEHKQ